MPLNAFFLADDEKRIARRVISRRRPREETKNKVTCVGFAVSEKQRLTASNLSSEF